MNMRRLAVIFAAALVLPFASPVRAQDAVAQAKALYASADYEQALNLLGSAPATREAHYYRALCLIALGRNAQAGKEITAVVDLDPLFVPDSAEVSPRVVTTFAETRREMLPQIARRTFNEARRLFQAGDKDAARGQFELTMRMLDESGLEEGDELADLRLVASGFLDLVRSTQGSTPEAEAQPAAAAEAARDEAPPAATPGTAVATATGPITLEQSLPPWRPDSATARRAFSGAVRVDIDETGRVTNAHMERPVHPAYDPLVLEAARRWTYKPATLNGVPVPSEKTVEIQLRPSLQ
jgi:TonB family protein